MKILIILPFLFFTFYSYGQIPKGEIKGPFTWESKIYPGTIRDYWIYVPKQYETSKPTCTMIVQDGLNRANDWKLTGVLDSLIATKEIPVIVGIFIDHGRVPATGNDNLPRFNRSLEYDALGDRYSRFLIEEIIPEVSKSYNLSKDPNDRSIAGASSGAICALNVAWERPDQFRRVLSTIGTYVGLRGGDEFATLIRKAEPKPLRIFLEDGDHDLNIYAGDWWMANQDMLSAMTWAGYEVNHAWGDGGHNGKHASTIMADALKWLWKDYPAPIQAHKPKEQRLDLTIEGESWKEITLPNVSAKKLAVNKEGEVFVADEHAVHKIDNTGSSTLLVSMKGTIGGIATYEGELLLADLSDKKIVSVSKMVSREVVNNVHADFMITSRNGIYFTESAKDRVGFYSFKKKNVQYVALEGRPTGLAVSAEQTFLNVGTANSVFGYSFKINDDGNLSHGQEYIHYHIPYGSPMPYVQGMTVDSGNILYSATGMGIQVSDQLGRINFIFSKPGEGFTDVKLGGETFSTMYVVCNGKLFSRKINAKGIVSWENPVRPPRPGL
jgi:enterochelin esterase-like enzyme